MSQSELSFWKDLIDKYLYPIDANKEEQVKYITTNIHYNLFKKENINIIFFTVDSDKIIATCVLYSAYESNRNYFYVTNLPEF